MMRAVEPSLVSDADLIAAIEKGNLQSLGQLFDRYQNDVRRLVVRLGVAAGDADDLVQDTFLEVMRAAPRFDRELPAKNWLFGLTVMLIRRHRRSLSRWAARLLLRASLPRPESPVTPAAQLEHDQELERFARAFEKLSDKKREVFALVALEGLSREEVGRVLAIAEPTVRTRLHHARLELRAALEESKP